MIDQAITTTIALDARTLFVVTGCVTALLGILLLFAWRHDRVAALAWWGAAYLVGAFAVGLWAIGAGTSALPTSLPAAVLFVACGMTWNAARIFHHRRGPVARDAGGHGHLARRLHAAGLPADGPQPLRARLGDHRALQLPHRRRAVAGAPPLAGRPAGPVRAGAARHGVPVPDRGGEPGAGTVRPHHAGDRLARGVHPRDAALRGRHRVPGARARQGAHPAGAQERGADRSAHRPVQPPRPDRGGARARREARPQGRQADRHAGVRSRPLQVGQRPVRPRARRRRDQAVRRDRELEPAAHRFRRPPGRRGIRRHHAGHPGGRHGGRRAHPRRLRERGAARCRAATSGRP